MNKEQRKQIAAVLAGLDVMDGPLRPLVEAHSAAHQEYVDALERLKVARAALVGPVDDALEQVEQIKDEEAEKLSNLPESLQNGDRGASMQEAIDYMESALEALEGARDVAEKDEVGEDDFDEFTGKLDDAIAALGDVP